MYILPAYIIILKHKEIVINLASRQTIMMI